MAEQRINVELPLPMSVVSRLALAIEAAWPGATVIPSEGPRVWSNDVITFAVDTATTEPILPIPDSPDVDGPDVDLVEFGERIGMSVPQWMGSTFVRMARAMLNEAGADNFVIINLTEESGEPWEVTVRRPNGETPTEQIARLRSELALALAAVEELRAAQ